MTNKTKSKSRHSRKKTGGQPEPGTTMQAAQAQMSEPASDQPDLLSPPLVPQQPAKPPGPPVPGPVPVPPQMPSFLGKFMATITAPFKPKPETETTPGFWSRLFSGGGRRTKKRHNKGRKNNRGTKGNKRITCSHVL